MGLFGRKQPTQPTGVTVNLGLGERDFEFDANDGKTITGWGYTFRDLDADTVVRHDDVRLLDAGCMVTKVSGVSYRAKELQRDDFEPGKFVRLIAEPRNPHDPNAVSVWDAKGKRQVGFVPRDDAPTVQRLVLGDEAEAMVVWEWRGEQGDRVGIKLLIAPPGTLPRR
jgi:hypothetical protein